LVTQGLSPPYNTPRSCARLGLTLQHAFFGRFPGRRMRSSERETQHDLYIEGRETGPLYDSEAITALW